MKYNELTLQDSEAIVALASELNPGIDIHALNSRVNEMFGYANYVCFGLTVESKLVGIASGWLTTRFYSGKQLEIDNVIISNEHRSQGYGAEFLGFIEKWAIKNHCQTIELNTYVANAKSHKFYFNQGYHILGYHFQKMINTAKKG